jgi:hypothetical protein
MHLLLLVTALLASALTAQDSPPPAQAAQVSPLRHLHPIREADFSTQRSSARLGAGNLRLLVSDAGTLDRALDQPRTSSRPVDLDTALARARRLHPADRIYVSLLTPETQAGMNGQTLTSLPLSVANAFEPQRTAQDVILNGDSAEVAGEAPAGGVLSSFQILSLRLEEGGGLN